MRKTLIALALVMVPQAMAMPVLAADQPRPPQGENRPQPTAEEKARHEARRKEWEAMTPEQREAKMKEHRAQREAKKKEMREKHGDRPQRPRKPQR